MELDQLEQLLENAQELEEKGDRYVDGEKAKRFYIRSCEIYSQINENEQDLPQVLSSWARILFILSEFKNPETSNHEACIWLSQALEKFLKLASVESENVDVLFNIAQTIHSLVTKSQPDIIKLNEAVWYLDQIKEVQSRNSETLTVSETDQLILRIEILNSIMEYSNDITYIQETFKSISAIYHESSESDVILRIAESYHIIAFKLFQITGVLDSDLFSNSLGYIDNVLNRQPNHIQGLCDRADLCISWADLAFQISKTSQSVNLYSEALEYLTKASQIEPRNLEILIKLGDIHLSRIRLYSNENTRLVCAKNAHAYYVTVLKKKPQMWSLFHYLKAISWISSDYNLESQRAWNMLSKMASNNSISLHEWMKSDDLLEVPYGPFWIQPASF